MGGCILAGLCRCFRTFEGALFAEFRKDEAAGTGSALSARSCQVRQTKPLALLVLDAMALGTEHVSAGIHID